MGGTGGTLFPDRNSGNNTQKRDLRGTITRTDVGDYSETSPWGHNGVRSWNIKQNLPPGLEHAQGDGLDNKWAAQTIAQTPALPNVLEQTIPETAFTALRL